MNTDQGLVFREGRALAFLPAVVFLAFCVVFFVVFKTFDVTALAAGVSSRCSSAPCSPSRTRRTGPP
ncbi:hypothetical protein ABT218_31395 [Streptomyces sp. NPDC001455]|uniref:hypothetical protein n=1 Tax=unclassified Streptomyces TaxID=2593676 RepID=UPI00332757CC